MSKIHIICLKWGTKFGPEYVNNLFNAILKHSTVPVNLHCFTEDASGITVPNVKIHPLPFDTLEGWWNKLYLFSNDLPIPHGEKILFVDLDTLITRSIDEILYLDVQPIVVLRDFYTGIAQSVIGENNMGSGFMMWNHGSYSHIWTRFIKNPQKIIKSIHPHGDQRWVQMNTPDRMYWQDIFPDRVVSFKVHCREGLPEKASVVCYHGKPSIPESIVNYTKSWKWQLTPAEWVREHWPTDIQPEKSKKAEPKKQPVKKYKTYFAMINANRVFGMIGRCGGGYNTVWEDWSVDGQIARQNIMREFEDGMNEICGHYSKLERSVLKEGFRNPVILTCGYPVRKSMSYLPPQLRSLNPEELLLMEGTTGGSRLHVAQKYNLKIPCFINDFTGKFAEGIEILTVEQAITFYKDKPNDIKLDPKIGLVEAFDPNKVGYHLGEAWSEDKMVNFRAPLWVKTMNKYGYFVDRLSSDVVQLLEQQGIYQPYHLKKSIDGRA
jgi:hypothetical protein